MATVWSKYWISQNLCIFQRVWIIFIPSDMSIETSLPEMFCWTETDWSRLEILASQNTSLMERCITVSGRMGRLQCTGVFLKWENSWQFLMRLYNKLCVCTYIFISIFLLYIGLRLSVWKTTNFPLPLMFGPSGSHYMRSWLTATLINSPQRYWLNGNSILGETHQRFKHNHSFKNTLIL